LVLKNVFKQVGEFDTEKNEIKEQEIEAMIKLTLQQRYAYFLT
jgi:hypothetical protein